ncbi:hypothetical protein BT69DRAFT_513520 [Atractiella rhizophila]|nr:hypothetical protein BT69DRAFT_513520 [Atractiella rhizophila]
MACQRDASHFHSHLCSPSLALPCRPMPISYSLSRTAPRTPWINFHQRNIEVNNEMPDGERRGQWDSVGSGTTRGCRSQPLSRAPKPLPSVPCVSRY